jgi:hypothetical protein
LDGPTLVARHSIPFPDEGKAVEVKGGRFAIMLARFQALEVDLLFAQTIHTAWVEEKYS